MTAILALEDGSVFHGRAIGACASACGEVCFNTSMTGYQEILTDPSYKGQIVTMTYPEIGNYGVNLEDVESYQPHIAGFVMREMSPVASSWRGRRSLGEYLESNGVPGIDGVDTRALTKKLRVRGALNGFISTENISPDDAKQRAAEWPGLVGVDYVKQVTHKEAFAWNDHDVRDKLNNIKRPIFIFKGEADYHIPDQDVLDTIDAIPDGLAEGGIAKGMGHLIMMEQPEKLAEACLTFLRGRKII